MTNFLFRLQRILELKAKKETHLAESLARALDRVGEAKEAQQSLDNVRRASVEQLMIAHSRAATAGQLQNMSFVLEQLNEHLASAQDLTSSAEADAVAAKDELVVAHQERRTLDRLRDRHHDEWTYAAARFDRQQMDAIALTRFAMANSTITNNR